MINVTKTYLPPLKEYVRYLEKIWKSGQLTNHGPLITELESKLKKYLGVKHLFCVANGTIGLQVAIKALDLKNEVITTPFSYIATSSCLIWEGCRPVYADINPETLTIDSKEIEKKITSKTTGILATHVFGNPCAVEKIDQLAKKNKLKVIYDAAHAFGVKYKGKSILNYGDISVLSFHATKIFNTIEGGAIVTNDDELAAKIHYLRNFGHESGKRPEKFIGLGINGKNSEFHSAMGLCLLPKMEKIIKARKSLSEQYDKYLSPAAVQKPKIVPGTEYNFSYYPVILPSEKKLLQTKQILNDASIFPRRYFFPSLNTVDYIKKMKNQAMPISEDISARILCLPLYPELKIKEIKLIAKMINAG